MISLVAVSMATVVLESLLYGLLLILFLTNLYLRITRYAKPQEFVSRGGLWWNPIVISNIAIFAISTAHWIITVERFFLAFLKSRGNPFQFYRDESQFTSIVSNTLVVAAVLIGDAVIVSVDQLVLANKWLAYGKLGPYYTHYYILHNIHCVADLENQSNDGRSWGGTPDGTRITSATLCISSSNLTQPVFVILIESAAIWTTWTIFFATTFLTGSRLQFIVRDLTPAIIGLVNLVIHLRVGLGWSRAEAPDATGAPMTSSASIFAVGLPTESNEYCP
ncbi:hypothetical protein C8R44DRAFT_882417 [Mycena epipterygia]|nr:hypothetical protein C8R44DRAFT_882417 [Mycena epipterygia]